MHDIVSNLTHMSRLHALLCQDDGRDAYHAAATDLRCAAATLDPVRLLLPTDCQEDHAAVVRQLAELRFLTCPTATAAAAAVIEALVLAHNGVISSTAASTVFEKALAEAGLPATVAEAPTWADSELRRLARAAIEAERRGDPIEAFLLSQLALFLAAWGCGATHGQENTVLNAGLAAGLESKCDCPDGGDAKDDSRVWQAPYQETHGIKCVKCHLNLSPLTLEALAACQKRTADAAQEARLPQADIASWCHHLCTSSAVPLRQYAAAVLVGHAAEDRQAVADLLAAGAIPGLRAALEEGRHPMVRSAAAYGLRTLCRDPAARSNAAAAGCLVPLSRQLAAKRVGPRRAAARALGNLFLAGESCKLQAERLGVAHSLIAMLSFDDVMGREAAAAALANLVANSADLQLAVGRLGEPLPSSICTYTVSRLWDRH